MAHQGHNGADVVPARCPQQHKARAEAGPGILVISGTIGADAVLGRFP